MQRHDGVFCEAEQEQRKDDREQRGVCAHLTGRQDASRPEVERACHVVDEDDRGKEQQLGCAQQIDDVLAGAGSRFGRLFVRNE